MYHQIEYLDNKTIVTLTDYDGNIISTYIFKGEVDFLTLCEHVRALKNSKIKDNSI